MTPGDGVGNKAKDAAPVTILKRVIDPSINDKQILREAGLISDDAATLDAVGEKGNIMHQRTL